MFLMAASGFAGIGYQIIWTQQSALWLGHESAAVLAVITAFLGGLAVGAWALGPRIDASPRPTRWYAGCELMIASWSIVLTLLMGRFSTAVLDLIGPQPTALWQWTVAFGSTFCLLFPATAAMGATLPSMERMTARWQGEARAIAALYASNTAGAMAGVLTIAFWLAPQFGLISTALICATVNIACAVISLYVFPAVSAVATPPMPPAAFASRVPLVQLALSGLLGIGYEVLVVRVISELAEDTVYTFAMLLAAYLLGTAIGAASYQRILRHHSNVRQLGDRIVCGVSVSCIVGTASLWFAEAVGRTIRPMLGDGIAAAVSTEALLAVMAFGLPTLAMGALFSHLSTLAGERGISLGRALGANTLGAAAAPVIFGVLALPTLGSKFSLLVVAAGYLLLLTWRNGAAGLAVVPLLIIATLAVWAPPLAFVELSQGGHIVSYQEGVMAAVSVVEDADGVARMRINNRQQEGSSSSLLVDGRQALLPVLLHPAPQRALFLGLGTGVTATTAAQDPHLQVDAVELLPEVIAASRAFAHVFADGSPRAHVMSADARRFVRTSTQHYDVIVADNFHPARSGSGSLYSVEHFAAVHSRLAVGGLFCQWLPLHQLDLTTLRSIVRSFLTIYPRGWAVLASNSLQTPVVGLIARQDGARFDLASLRDRLADANIPRNLDAFRIEDELALLGSFIAGPASLRQFAGDAPANTDDHPIVAYRAPLITYAPDSTPGDRLIDLLTMLSIEPAELLDAATDKSTVNRLTAYWAARNRFIAAGRDVRPSADVHVMLAQVREPLLSILRISPNFRPAYDPLLSMATRLARVDRSAARELLSALKEIQPARSEATDVLRDLETSTH